MQTRQNALNEWLQIQLNHKPYTITPLAGDASFRRYFRVFSSDTDTRIVMDAPPDKETISPFIHMNQILKDNGLLTPTIHAADLSQGFALLDDLGDTLFQDALTSNNQDNFYINALDTLIQMQRCSTTSCPIFDKQHMHKEMSLFPEWFLTAYLQLTLTEAEYHLIETTFNWLTERLSNQPQVFIHRDYHSRNLMIINNVAKPQLGIIDFQDAMRGPITYDLVSLLKDCYIKLLEPSYYAYAEQFYQRQSLVQTWSMQQFLDEVDFCGLQRHIKVLGIFSRLHIRDNKPNYLANLPLTLDYTLACLRRHPPLKPLLNFMEQRVVPRFIEINQA